ncbi:MAG: hypothetical protein IKN04_07195 [Clostridia bacterium]|nr:hypothetical protein [Clostridia bacterium]
MSSVPKSKRGKSPAEFLELARQLKFYTIDKCADLPKKYKQDMWDPMKRLANDAKDLILYANSIFPTNKALAEERANAFKRANAKLTALASDVDDFEWLKDEIPISYEIREEWTRMAYTLRNLVDGVMESDKKRFRFP